MKCKQYFPKIDWIDKLVLIASMAMMTFYPIDQIMLYTMEVGAVNSVKAILWLMQALMAKVDGNA